MKRIVFIHTQTLYAKATIPLAVRFAQAGYRVDFKVNRPTVFGISFGFSDSHIRANPTTVSVVNPQSLRFVARLIGYDEEWHSIRRGINYANRDRWDRYDAVIGTTKDLGVLKNIRSTHGIPAFALGYQHIPFTAKVDDPISPNDTYPENFRIFLADNAFANSHRFSEILAGCGAVPCGFTFMDKVRQLMGKRGIPQESARAFALVFHPGGYRRVITDPGDPKEVCYEKQRRFLERTCLPLLRVGLRPVVKIHPLRAIFHDLEDVSLIAREIEKKENLPTDSILCIGPASWYWDYAFKSGLILGFGSSSIYELWSAGLRNAFVCNYEGTARSRKFRFFDGVFINNYEEYLAWLENGRFDESPLGELGEQVFQGYSSLNRGVATETSFNLIAGAIS